MICERIDGLMMGQMDRLFTKLPHAHSEAGQDTVGLLYNARSEMWREERHGGDGKECLRCACTRIPAAALNAAVCFLHIHCDQMALKKTS